MKRIIIYIITVLTIQNSKGQVFNAIPYRLCTDCPQTENASLLNTLYNYGNVAHFAPCYFKIAFQLDNIRNVLFESLV